MSYKQGEILLVPFPFTDLSSTKQRPVLVLSKSSDNQMYDDLVTCAITSRIKTKPYSVEIKTSDLVEGELPVQSIILVSKLFTIEQGLIIKSIGTINDDKIDKVKEIYRSIVE